MREFLHVRRVNDWIRIITLISGIGMIAGMAWAICSYPMQWSDNSRRLNKLEPVVLKNEADISTLQTEHLRMEGDMKVITSQYQDIKEDLQYLRRKADR